MSVKRQSEIGHFRAKVGECPFCRSMQAELWYEPGEHFQPYQVRCRGCGARGPWCDCGWESAVPAWDMVGRKEGFTPTWRGPGAEDADTAHPLPAPASTGGREPVTLAAGETP